MTLYGYTLLLLLLTGFSGFALAAWLLPRGLQRYTLLLCPWFGIAYLTAAVYVLYWLEAPGTDAYAAWLLIPPALGIAFFLARPRNQKMPLWNAETALALVPVVLTAILVTQTIWHAFPVPTSISRGNNDIAGYAMGAEIIRTSARHAITIEWARLMCDKNWAGPIFLLALCSSWTGCPGYALVTIFFNVLFLLSVAAVYPLARQFGAGRKAAAAISLVYGTSSLMQQILFNNYGGQLMGSGFMILALIGVGHFCNREWRRRRDHLPSLLVAFWGLLISYPIMIPLTAGFAALTGPLALAGAGRRARALRTSFWLLGTGLLSLVLFLPRVMNCAKSVGQLAAHGSGGFQPLIPFSLLLGFSLPPWLDSIGWPFGCLMGVAIATAIISFVRRPFSRGWRPVLILLSYGTLCLLLAYRGREGDVWGGYESYKLAAFYFPLFLVAVWVLLHAAGRNLPLLRIPLPICLGVMLTANLVSGYCVWKVIGAKEVLRQETIDLHRLESLPVFDSINVPDLPIWDATWVISMLEKKTLYAYPYGLPEPGPLPQGHWDLLLLRKGSFSWDNQLFIVHSAAADSFPIIFANQEFGLRRHSPSAIDGFFAGPGWWPADPDCRWTGQSGRSATALLFSREGPLSALLDFTVDLRPGEKVEVFLNGKSVGQASSPGSHQFPLVLDQGTNQLVFTSNLDPSRQNPKDKRVLGLRFTRLTVSPSVTRKSP